ncbi:MAG: helix-turn-helix domain-containing protein [Calditrichota bacterium]
MSKIGDRIRHSRKSARMSQEELAERIRVNRSYLSLVENGKSSPTFEFLEKVAAGLGITVEDLITGPPNPETATGLIGDRPVYEGLAELLNDEQQMLLMNPSTDELRMLRAIRVDPGYHPSKKFFVEALLDYRKNRLMR